MKRVVHKIPIETGTGGQSFIKIFFDVYSDYYAIIDTGSDQSFVCADCYQCLMEKARQIDVSGASGKTSIEAYDEYVTMLARDINGKIVEIHNSMLVVSDFGVFRSISTKIPADIKEGAMCCMIIGCDILREMNAVINLDMNILTLFGGYDNSDE